MSAVNSFGAKDTLKVGRPTTRSSESTRSTATRSSRSASRCCSRTCSAPRTARTSPPTQIRALGDWVPTAEPDTEIQFTPARVVMQDFTGVPCIVDLATMREAVAALGGDPDEDQPARTRRAGHRPLGHRRPLRHRERARAQRRDRVRAQRRALPVPPLGPDRVRRLQGRPAGNRHRAPGQHRVPGARHL